LTPALPFQLVDAFAEQPFRGNRAGVVFDADGLTPQQMQRMALEVGASETAFLSRLNDLHRPPLLRWFTPTTEVDFCGHATLAAAHALHHAGRWQMPTPPDDATLMLACRPGRLTLSAEPLPRGGLMWWLDMPTPKLRPDNTNPVRTCKLLGITPDDLDPALPAMRTGDGDLIYLLRDWPVLMEMRPQFDELAAWCTRQQIRGICVATTQSLADTVDVHSRFFAPAVGVNEDPVTGSVHGPLAVYLVVNGLVGSAAGRSSLTCAQGCGDRTGLVRVITESTPAAYRVRLAGQCFTTIDGTLRVPDR
jgi:trans-2,3-dihydro-3-hydroxyanthranilate isomerase